MKNIKYTFICIGTNKLISDSFGPRVGNKLTLFFSQFPQIKVYGTMKNPIHLANATYILKNIKEQGKIIIIDSAIGKKENMGKTYVSSGGVEIGKAFNKSIYIPANINIKTVIGTKEFIPNYTIEQIDKIAEGVYKNITNNILQLLV